MELSKVQIQPLRTRAQKGSWDAVPWDALHTAAQLGQGGNQEKAMSHTGASSPRFTAPAFQHLRFSTSGTGSRRKPLPPS